MLVRLARDMDMSIAAEGIETEAQVAALLSCGVRCGQGYLVAPPVPLASFLALVDRFGGRAGSARITSKVA